MQRIVSVSCQDIVHSVLNYVWRYSSPATAVTKLYAVNIVRPVWREPLSIHAPHTNIIPTWYVTKAPRYASSVI